MHPLDDERGVVLAELLCRLLTHFCRYKSHEGHGNLTPAVLAGYGLLADFRFSMLAAGHYRRPRHFYCRDIRDRSCFIDARVTISPPWTRRSSTNLHAPLGLQALYAALRRGQLSGDEQAVLAATGRLLFDVSEGPFAGRHPAG